MIVFLDNLVLKTRLLFLASPGQLCGVSCCFSCSCRRDSLGENVSVVIYSINLFEHFSGLDKLSAADAHNVG